MAKRYGKISFCMDEGHSCCGQGVVYEIEESEIEAPVWSRVEVWPTHKSREEQFDDLLARVEERVEEDTTEFNDNRTRYASGEKVDCCYGFLSMTLIKGPKEQIPGLIEYLTAKGWEIGVEVVNPKTENLLVHLTKVL